MNIRDKALEYGFEKSRVFAALPSPNAPALIEPLNLLETDDPHSTTLYHSSYGLEAITKVLTQIRHRLYLSYHNITPSSFFEKVDFEFARGLEYGRTELELIRPLVVRAFADSDFNKRELESLGYQNAKTCPVGLDVFRLLSSSNKVTKGCAVAEGSGAPYAIAISQIHPHKCLEEIVLAIWAAQVFLNVKLNLTVVGRPSSPVATERLIQFGKYFLRDGFHYLGPVSDAELSELVSGANLYLNLSRHEGLSVPLLECMAAGVPCIVRNAGALAETCRDGAVVVSPSADTAEVAFEIANLVHDDSFRASLVRAAQLRASEFDLERSLDFFFTEIESTQS